MWGIRDVGCLPGCEMLIYKIRSSKGYINDHH